MVTYVVWEGEGEGEGEGGGECGGRDGLERNERRRNEDVNQV